MKDENYPQELTADERDIGFELLLLEADGSAREESELFESPVIVKRLSSFDVIVKSIAFGDVVYIHKRFGRDRAFKSIEGKEVSNPEWWPLSNGNQNAIEAIRLARAGSTSAPYAEEIEPVEFKYAPVTS